MITRTFRKSAGMGSALMSWPSFITRCSPSGGRAGRATLAVSAGTSGLVAASEASGLVAPSESAAARNLTVPSNSVIDTAGAAGRHVRDVWRPPQEGEEGERRLIEARRN